MKKVSKNIIKKEYLEKISLVKRYNEAYYLNSNPKVSDAFYDELKKKILDLEKKYTFLSSNDSPSKL